MTPRTEQQPQMSVEEFEQLERHAPETVWLEFINGKVQVKPVPDGDHSEIIAWLQRLCMQQRPELWLHGERGLKTERYRKGRAGLTVCSCRRAASKAMVSGRKRTKP